MRQVSRFGDFISEDKLSCKLFKNKVTFAVAEGQVVQKVRELTHLRPHLAQKTAHAAPHPHTLRQAHLDTSRAARPRTHAPRHPHAGLRARQEQSAMVSLPVRCGCRVSTNSAEALRLEGESEQFCGFALGAFPPLAHLQDLHYYYFYKIIIIPSSHFSSLQTLSIPATNHSAGLPMGAPF